MTTKWFNSKVFNINRLVPNKYKVNLVFNLVKDNYYCITRKIGFIAIKIE